MPQRLVVELAEGTQALVSLTSFFTHTCEIVLNVPSGTWRALFEPLGYVDLLSLVRASAFVITDSGGLQKEAYYARKRCIVVMPDTGWRELTETGWNVLSNTQAHALAGCCEQICQLAAYPENMYGHGDAAYKIIKAVQKLLC